MIALGHLSMALGLLGFADQFEQRSRESLDLAQHLAHPFSCAQAVGISCITNLLCHRVRDAGEAAEALLTLGLEQGFEFWRVLGLGLGTALQGQPEAGVADVRRSMAAAENTGTLLLEVLLLAPLAEALGHIGEIQEGLALLDRQRRLAADTGLAVCDAEWCVR